MTSILKTAGLNRLVIFSFATLLALNFGCVILIRLYGSLMYPFFVIIYIWISSYVLLITTIIHWQRKRESSILGSKHLYLILFAITVLPRLLFIGTTQIISLDPLWYLDYGEFMTAGSIPYLDFYFPYPPLFAYIIYPVSIIFPSPDAFRFIAAILDGFVCIIIYEIVNLLVDRKWACVVAIGYIFLPISIIESGWNGHFEPLANLFMLLGIWLMLNNQNRLASVSTVLGAAVKIYPLFLLPVIILHSKSLRERIITLVISTITGLLTFIPIAIAALYHSDSSASSIQNESSSTGIVGALLGPLADPSSQFFVTSLVVTIFMGIGVLLIFYYNFKDNPSTNSRAFQQASIILGILLICLGIIAGAYPFTSLAHLFHWRFSLDFAIVRGTVSIMLGIVTVAVMYQSGKKEKTQITQTHIIGILLGSIIILLGAFSRTAFFGWYLLWSLPLFLLLPRKRLVILAFLSLLILYPSYTDDNFSGFGFNESRTWEEQFVETSGWTSSIESSLHGNDTPLISHGVASINGNGRFWINSTDISNISLLTNLVIVFQIQVQISYTSLTEFQTRIASNWDPTFGRKCEISMEYSGIDEFSRPTTGSIIPRSGLFTNLTYFPWRYSFFSQMTDYSAGVVRNLTVSMYPLSSSYQFYDIDFLYTVEGGVIHPQNLIIVPSLIAITLTSCFLLYRELEHYIEYEDRMVTVHPA